MLLLPTNGCFLEASSEGWGDCFLVGNLLVSYRPLASAGRDALVTRLCYVRAAI